MLFNFDLQKNKKTQIIHDPIRLTIGFSGTGEVFMKNYSKDLSMSMSINMLMTC